MLAQHAQIACQPDHIAHGICFASAITWHCSSFCLINEMSKIWRDSGEDEERAGLAAIGTWQQDLLLFSLPHLQPLQSEELGEVLL